MKNLQVEKLLRYISRLTPARASLATGVLVTMIGGFLAFSERASSELVVILVIVGFCSLMVGVALEGSSKDERK